MKHSAFSLIELMISIALCALVVALLVVNVSFLNRGIVRSEIDKLYSVCMYLQQCALTTHQEHELTFDTKNNTYRFAGKTETLRFPVEFGFPCNVKGPPSTPRKKIFSAVTFKGGKILFYPEGIISSGTVYLTDRNKTVLYALSSGIAHVSHLRKYSYTDKWNLLP